MGILKQTSIVGSHVHEPTGHRYDYEVECRIAGDTQGLEWVHLSVLVSRGNASTGFVATGHVEPDLSFVGREEQLAMECVALACARVAATPAQEAASGWRRFAQVPGRVHGAWPLMLDEAA